MASRWRNTDFPQSCLQTHYLRFTLSDSIKESLKFHLDIFNLLFTAKALLGFLWERRSKQEKVEKYGKCLCTGTIHASIHWDLNKKRVKSPVSVSTPYIPDFYFMNAVFYPDLIFSTIIHSECDWIEWAEGLNDCKMPFSPSLKETFYVSHLNFIKIQDQRFFLGWITGNSR